MKRHLSEERLIELTLRTLGQSNALADAVADDHLAVCGSCRERAVEMARLLDDTAAVANAEADAAFPDDRLARQHARIVQRIEQEGRPGRLIAFPAGQQPAPLLTRSRPASRWVAAAAVAGLVVGLVTGQLIPVGQSPVANTARVVFSDGVANEAGTMELRVVSTTMSDDEFLGEVEAAGSQGPPALRPLDALTPRAWEVSR